MKAYLESTGIIDWRHSDSMALAGELSKSRASDEEVARACFEWVRDNMLLTCMESMRLHSIT